MKFHHLGLAVRDIPKESEFYLSIGAQLLSPVTYDPLQGVKLQLLEIGGQLLELVSPADESTRSPVDYFLQHNHRIYHTCYEVSDIQLALERLKSSSCILIKQPTPAILFENRLVAFVLSPNRDLIELLNSK